MGESSLAFQQQRKSIKRTAMYPLSMPTNLHTYAC